MRVLTSPCASSQYLPLLFKKSLASFALPFFSAPMIFYKNPNTHFNSIEHYLQRSYHRTQSMIYQMISTEPRARFTELALPANSDGLERVTCSQDSRSCTLDHFIHFLHLPRSKTPASIGPEIRPRLQNPTNLNRSASSTSVIGCSTERRTPSAVNHVILTSTIR
jgi:hypothetical protein